MRATPFRDKQSRFLAGRFGVWLFLASLSMLFAASIVAFIVIRVQLADRGLWPEDLPPLPRALWISTLTLILSSVTMQRAVNAARDGRTGPLCSNMLMTALLGALFLTVQALCWLTWLEPVSQRWQNSDEYRFALTSFYVLTIIHALHVIGGLVPMMIVTHKAFLGEYSPSNDAGVRYLAMYWHFLGAVWIALLTLLMTAM